MMALNRPMPAPLGPVAELLAMDRTTLTAALKPLRRRGLVAIAVDPADRRGRLLTLTEAGMALLAAAVPIWQRTHEAIEAAMPGIETRCRVSEMARQSSSETRTALWRFPRIWIGSCDSAVSSSRP